MVPAEGFDQPIAAVDARDLAVWLVEMVDRGQGGAVDATGPGGMTTLRGLLELCREATSGDVGWVPVPEQELLDVGVEPWSHLPFWLPADVAGTAWDVDTTRARELGLPSRPLRETVEDTWTWMQTAERTFWSRYGHPRPGLPEGLGTELLADR